MSDDLLYRGLPKWPQMRVTGLPVTLEQAKEIIRRTDTFFTKGYDGNNHAYNQRVRIMLAMPLTRYDSSIEETRARWAMEAAWREKWKCIPDLTYVHNSWISNAFIGGPYGWCHPDGNIGYVDNVGKWPSVTEIFADWQTLSGKFPFLDIGVTLYDGEQCEEGTKPVVSIQVKSGKVELVDPDVSNVHHGHPEAVRAPGGTADLVESMTRRFSSPRSTENGEPSCENAIPWDWFEQWRKDHLS